MAKEKGFKLQIPKLKKQTNLTEWKETLESELGTNPLKHFLHYDVQRPKLVKITGKWATSETEQVRDALPRDSQNRMRQSTKMITFTEENDELPDMLINLAIACSFIVDDDLFAIYSDADAYKKARSDWIRDVERVRVIVRSSIAYENVHLFKDNNVYRAFATVVSQFAKEMKLERMDVKRRLRNLKCHNLKTYVNDFKRLLVELDHADGDRNSEEVLTIFLSNLPNSSFLTYKTLFNGNQIDEAFNYFRDIGDRQNNFKKMNNKRSELTPKSDRSNTHLKMLGCNKSCP